jgi:glutathione peroxidase
MSRVTAYAFTFAGLKGDDIRLADHAGKPILIVNTASQCGYTPQYTGLQQLWSRFRDRGFLVVGVPSNDFGGQEPGSAEEIGRFCGESFDVTFPLADKQVVSGRDAHPLYRWAASQTGPLGTPGWNFHKILIGRDGRIVDWFSAVSGTGARLERAVEAALAAKG